MQEIIQEALPIVLVLLLGVLLLIILLQRHRLSAPLRRLTRSRRQGAEGEKVAAQWLKKKGFKEIQSQYVFHSSYEIDGHEKEFQIKPDFLATKGGEEWIIEVKTGSAASPSSIPTRRQLREYATLFPGCRYALFDGSNKKLHEVSFESEKINSPSIKSTLILMFLSFALGVGVALFFLLN